MCKSMKNPDRDNSGQTAIRTSAETDSVAGDAREHLDRPQSPSEPSRDTALQKALKPVLNWCVERFFPTGAFFGRFYLRDLQADIKLPERWEPNEMTCVLFLAAKIRERGAEKAQITASNVTSSGVEVGSWRVTIEKIV